MTSLLALRSPGPGAPPWALEAHPYGYEEAGRAQFQAMPGIQWVRDPAAVNGRGFYRGPREAVEIVATLLESAGVVRLTGYEPPPEIRWAGYQANAMPPGLRDYQLHGALWLRRMCAEEGGGLLADEMGIGKSAQAIVAAGMLGPKGILTVCPAVVRSHWKNQWARWGSEAEGLGVMSYEGFAKAAAKGLAWAPQGVILDECHYLSNPRAKRTAAVAAWRQQHPQIPVIMLSGTPMTARPKDLWSPLSILHPGRWGKAFAFQKRYCDGKFVELPHMQRHVWSAEGCSRTAELAARLRAVMLRRTKAEVALELPPITRVVHEVELPAAARKALQRAAAALGHDGSRVSELLSGVEEYKLDAAAALAREIQESGGRPLILTLRKASVQALVREIPGSRGVTGDTAPEDRAAALEGAACGVATLASVTTGIDLTSFDAVIFVGLDWIPSTILQGEARIHRLGQQAARVTAYYLVGLGTLDEVVRERVLDRIGQWGEISGEGDASGLGGALGGGAEDDLLKAIVATVKGM